VFKYEGEKYSLTDNVDEFCKTISKKGKAALKLHLRDERMIREQIPIAGDKYIPNSSYEDKKFDSWFVCEKCHHIFRRVFDMLPDVCESCDSENGILLMDNIEPVITTKDSENIREYFHASAKRWWSKQSHDDAACDYCGRGVNREDGYLYGTYLLCTKCCSELPMIADIQKQSMSFELVGILRRARKYKATGIIEHF
jgi:hypothetical protein